MLLAMPMQDMPIPDMPIPDMPIPDMQRAASVLEVAKTAVEVAIAHLAGFQDLDQHQVVAYDLSHAAAGIEAGRSLIDYGAKGEVEAAIACAFTADAIHDFATRILGREAEFGLTPGALSGTYEFLRDFRDPKFLASLAETPGPRHLDPEFEMVQDSFRRFANEKIAPVADEIHRTNGDVPEEIISGLAEMGAFGLSIPETYGGFASEAGNDYTAMVVATEELSRGSLGIGGSLITRPEILARALVKGGTEEQKHHWLPKLAMGEIMNAVAVTEPDYGSDVAGLTTTATRSGDGWLINGVKTWCTFAGRADVLMLLVRTDPDRTKSHRGLSLFIVEKERGSGHGFVLTQAPSKDNPTGGRIEARPIDTIGYRGMHSFEVAIESFYVPNENLIGGEAGLGKGFYFQMGGFENGRIQTAARAVGVMQAAYEAALEYAKGRKVFSNSIIDYQLTRAKLGKMAAIVQASRQFSYHVANLMAKGQGSVEASMAKAYVCRAAEWVTREAMQIHGGMGYAEEFPVSRYFVDARVLSIFEGADETLALKVIARKLVDSQRS